MAWVYGKLFDNAEQFLAWLQTVDKSKHPEVHVHHTLEPSHEDFNGSNYRALQDAMRNYHVNTRGWQDIGQHITIFPDGKIMTGRDVNTPPASATGYNDSDPDGIHPFMFEMVGNFDKPEDGGKDKLEGKQLESAIKICRYFYDKGAKIVFHRQCLINGKMPKTCPGTGVDYDWFVGLVKNLNKPTVAPAKPVIYLPTGILKQGDRGDNVKKLQVALNAAGFNCGQADGIFGKLTYNAVVALQKAAKITVDGIYGPQTRQALAQKLSAKYVVK